MKIGIIGSGPVGQSLAKGFFKHGHSVMIGSRDTNKLLDWSSKAGLGIALGSFAQASAHGEVLVLAVKGSVAKDVLQTIQKSDLKGKCIIDTTNPIDSAKSPENGVLYFTSALDHSLMEELQKTFPESNFVKAFNSIGSAHMVNPDFDQKPSMFICGNNEGAKGVVSNILRDFGYLPEDMGTAISARAIEPLCMLWCIPGFLRNEWNHAFKLIKKTEE